MSADKSTAAHDILAQLTKSFVAALPERLSDMEALILDLKNNETFLDSYQELFRKVHSLKGSGGTYGFPIITLICHQFEDNLKRVSEETSVNNTFIDSCFKYIDLLQRSYEIIHAGQSDFTAIRNEIEHHQQTLTKNKLRCLIVEQSRTITSLYTEALKPYNIDITLMTSGYEALERLLQERFDLLICSMETGILNGVSLIAAIRTSRSINSNIDTILLTSSTAAQGINEVVKPNHIIKKGANMISDLQSYINKLNSVTP
jgi:chemotaxis protein histidine kinase CheA